MESSSPRWGKGEGAGSRWMSLALRGAGAACGRAWGMLGGEGAPGGPKDKQMKMIHLLHSQGLPKTMSPVEVEPCPKSKTREQ